MGWKQEIGKKACTTVKLHLNPGVRPDPPSALCTTSKQVTLATMDGSRSLKIRTTLPSTILLVCKRQNGDQSADDAICWASMTRGSRKTSMMEFHLWNCFLSLSD